MLYSRFLASLLAKHKRDGAARGRMPQQGPPTQQPQASSSAPVYQQQQQQQQRPTAQQAPPSHSGASPSSFTTGGNTTSVQDVPQTLRSEQTVSQTQTEFKDTAKINEPIQPLEPLPYHFGTNAPPPSNPMDMDFTFDSIAIDELLGPMKAIDNPLWMQTMMLPGYVLTSFFHLNPLVSSCILQILVADGRELFILWQQHGHRWLPTLYGSPTYRGAPRLRAPRRRGPYDHCMTTTTHGHASFLTPA